MTRPLRLVGALAVLASLWLPWYAVHIPDAVRAAFDQQSGQLPPGFADFARGLLDALPRSVTLNGWQSFEGADVALALLAGAVAVSLLLAIDVRAILGLAAAIAGLVLVHVLDQPGPNEIVNVKVGSWVALAGAAAIALSARDELAAPASAGGTWAPAPSDPAPPPAPSVAPPQ
jgi:hypothetical protein